MSLIQGEPVTRNIPYQLHAAEGPNVLVAGARFDISFSVAIGQASRTSPADAPADWLVNAIDTRFAAAYTIDFAFGADTTGMLVAIRGAYQFATNMILLYEFAPTGGIPALLTVRFPFPYGNLTMTNPTAGSIFGTYYNMFIRD